MAISNNYLFILSLVFINVPLHSMESRLTDEQKEQQIGYRGSVKVNGFTQEIELSPDNKWLLVRQSAMTRMFDVEQMAEVLSFEGSDRKVVFRKDTDVSLPYMYRTNRGYHIDDLALDASVKGIDSSHDSKRIARVFGDGHVEITNAETGQLETEFRLDDFSAKTTCRRVQFSGDNDRLIVHYGDGKGTLFQSRIHVYNLNTSRSNIIDLDGEVVESFSPDGDYAFTSIVNDLDNEGPKKCWIDPYDTIYNLRKNTSKRLEFFKYCPVAFRKDLAKAAIWNVIFTQHDSLRSEIIERLRTHRFCMDDAKTTLVVADTVQRKLLFFDIAEWGKNYEGVQDLMLMTEVRANEPLAEPEEADCWSRLTSCWKRLKEEASK